MVLIVNLITPSYIYRGASITTVINRYDSSLLILSIARITEYSRLGHVFS